MQFQFLLRSRNLTLRLGDIWDDPLVASLYEANTQELKNSLASCWGPLTQDNAPEVLSLNEANFSSLQSVSENIITQKKKQSNNDSLSSHKWVVMDKTPPLVETKDTSTSEKDRIVSQNIDFLLESAINTFSARISSGPSSEGRVTNISVADPQHSQTLNLQDANNNLSDIFLIQNQLYQSVANSHLQFLVQFERNTTATQKASIIGLVGGEIHSTVRPSDTKSGELVLISVNSNQSTEFIIEALSKNPFVKFAEPNAELRIQADVTDTYYMNNSMWGMYGDKTSPYTNVFGSQAGEVIASGIFGNSSIVVGDVDTGIDYTHPDLYLNIWLNQAEISTSLKMGLKDTDQDGLITFRDLNNSINSTFVSDFNANGRIDAGDLLKDSRWCDGADQDGNGYKDDLIGWDFVNNDNDPYDDNKHGTHTSGTIGASNDGSGVVGVCSNIQMMALKFLSGTGSGATSNAIKAIDYYSNIAANDKTVSEFIALNNSWGGSTFSQSLLDSITRAALQDILFVAAAGNGGSDGVGDNNDKTANYPSNYSTLNSAGYETVIAVAALTNTGTLASYSNFGTSSVDIGAPGSSILSTVPGGGYAYLSGTSMATPHVTGALALLASYFPTYSAVQLRDLLLQKIIATPSLQGLTTTGGRLDVSNLFGLDTPPQTSTVSVGVDALTINEGNSGTTSVTFNILLSKPLSSDQIVNWSLSGGGNNPADMTSDIISQTSGSVTFSSSLGETQKTVTVSIIGDTQIENDETLIFSLQLPNSLTNLALGTSTTTLTLLNDDDDIPCSNTTLTSLTVNGGAVNNTINFIGDGDAYKVSLVAGTVYCFDLTKSSTGSLNPFIELYDQNFILLSSNDDGNAPPNSQLYYTAAQTGTFFIAAKGALGSVGGYVLNATDQNTLTGTTSNDTLSGSILKDTIYGLAGNDSLNGSDGDDVLNGGAGDDILNGGNGNDTASYDGATSAISISLAISNSQNTGGAGRDTLNSIENLLGGQANDTLTGNSTNNRIEGGAGNDTINGGTGNDTLVGGQGKDSFVFNSALGSSNVDSILDFNVSEDILQLENAVMTKIGKAGTLGSNLFKIVGTGTTQQDSNDYILYDAQTGFISYDADANGSGAPVQFAKIAAGLSLTANNFLVI